MKQQFLRNTGTDLKIAR